MKYALFAAAAVLTGGVAHAAPLADYGRLPAMDQVAISPDGARVAFTQSVNGKTAVVVDQLNPASVVINLPPSDQPVRALIWADATHLLLVKSPTAPAGSGPGAAFGPSYGLQSLDLEKRKVTPLLNFPDDRQQDTRAHGASLMRTSTELPQIVTVKGHTTVFLRGSTVDGALSAPALMSSDLVAAKDEVLDKSVASDPGRRWIVNDQGEPIAQTRYEDRAHIWTLQIKQGGRWTDAYSSKPLAPAPQLLGPSADGASLILQLTKDDGATEYRSVSLADGKVSEPLAEYDGLSTLIHDPATQRVIGGVKKGMEPLYVFFDPKDQAGWDAVAKSFPDEQADPVSWSRDRSKIVVRVTSARRGIAYAVVDLASRKAIQIGPAYQGITGADVADVAIAAYPAKDGQTIQAYLTLPTGKDAKNLPLIVLAHDGPGGRDQAGFDWWAQAMASRGYAVLQPQFRGSSGFDWKLQAAGFGEFGRKMQSDLSDGVRALAAKGYIDPKRVCIVGAGYGGYAALAGATMEPGVYRCAVSVAGVSDLKKLASAKSASASAWDKYLGSKGPADPVLDQVSPARHAADASGPILLIHDVGDTVAPIDQSQGMEIALKQAGKPVEFVTLASEDHALAREATRQQMLQATLAFLEKNNPPQ
jgi:dipeptidyl aminopeptidase/acylaminoacyl peptidase